MLSFHCFQDSVIMLSQNKLIVTSITLQHLLFLIIPILIPMKLLLQSTKRALSMKRQIEEEI